MGAECNSGVGSEMKTPQSGQGAEEQETNEAEQADKFLGWSQVVI